MIVVGCRRCRLVGPVAPRSAILSTFCHGQIPCGRVLWVLSFRCFYCRLHFCFFFSGQGGGTINQTLKARRRGGQVIAKWRKKAKQRLHFYNQTRRRQHTPLARETLEPSTRGYHCLDGHGPLLLAIGFVQCLFLADKLRSVFNLPNPPHLKPAYVLRGSNASTVAMLCPTAEGVPHTRHVV